MGVDGSEHAEYALRIAQVLAARLSAQLVIAHAADYHVPFAPMDPYGDFREVVREQGERLLHEARRKVTAPVESVVEDLRLGSVRPGLLEAIAEHQPMIAVMGHRGLHGFRGLLVGSVARDMVQYGSCPVLVARPQSKPEASPA